MTLKAAASRVLVLLGALVLAQGGAAADTYAATPSDYLALLRKLRPGDTLVLAPGQYREGLPLHELNGATGKRVVIRGSRDAPATLVARTGANTISIVNASHVEARDLILDGEGPT